MSLHQKVDDVWVTCARPYVQRNGVWTGVSEAWVKRSGVWAQAYNYDVTPPNPPEITLQVAEDFDVVKGVKKLKTRYIRVGVRLPGSASDPEARLVRVLTDYAGAAPTTQFGGTYTTAPDANYPSEHWSEWRYNAYGPHKDTSVIALKQWPRNAGAGDIIAGDRTYHFGAWTLDNAGNWSIATQASIHVPKASVDAPNVIVKETRIQPNTSGSWRISSGFASGPLVQQKSPRSQGLWLYGNQFTDSIGSQGTPTIRSAQIYIRREDDGGSATANIYLFWTTYANTGSLPTPGSGIGASERTKIGTLSKGEGKWFELPDAFKNNLNTQLKGMGLDWKDPVKADAFPDDYSSIASVASNLRCGEVHIVWEEAL